MAAVSTIVMGAAMAAIMLGFMAHMLQDKAANLGILLGSAAMFAVSLWLVRSQQTVDDLSDMRAMIPHDSMAILTSTRARIRDERVRKLADGIAQTQEKEIAEMRALITDMDGKR